MATQTPRGCSLLRLRPAPPLLSERGAQPCCHRPHLPKPRDTHRLLRLLRLGSARPLTPAVFKAPQRPHCAQRSPPQVPRPPPTPAPAQPSLVLPAANESNTAVSSHRSSAAAAAAAATAAVAVRIEGRPPCRLLAARTVAAVAPCRTPHPPRPQQLQQQRQLTAVAAVRPPSRPTPQCSAAAAPGTSSFLPAAWRRCRQRF